MPTKNCPVCQRSNPENAKHCDGCGSAFGPVTQPGNATRRLNPDAATGATTRLKLDLTCTECGSVIPEGQRFCGTCGAAAPEPEPASAEPRIEAMIGSTIILSQMLADVEVIPEQRDDIVFTIEGDVRSRPLVELKQLGEEIKLTCPLPFKQGVSSLNRSGRHSSYGSSFVQTVSFGGISSINGVQYMDGQEVDMRRKLRITIAVPRGTKVVVGKILGFIEIGDTEGDLEARISGQTGISAGKVTNPVIDASGQGSISIREASGEGSIDLSGMGSVTIAGGTLSNLKIDLSGMGRVSFEGVTDRVSGSLSGMGRVYIAETKTRSQIRKSGMGQVAIGRQPSTGSGFSDY